MLYLDDLGIVPQRQQRPIQINYCFRTPGLMLDDFHKAVHSHDLNLMQSIWPHVAQRQLEKDIIAFDKYDVFRNALQNLCNKIQALMYYNIHGDAYGDAGRKESMDVIQFLHDRAVEQGFEKDMLLATETVLKDAIKKAARKGDLKTLAFLWDYQKEILQGDYSFLDWLLEFAIMDGYLNVVQFLYDKAVELDCLREIILLDPDSRSDYYFGDVITHAVQFGKNIDVLKFLWHKAEQLGDLKEILLDEHGTIFALAVDSRDLELVEFLYGKAVELGCHREMLALKRYDAFYWILGQCEPISQFLWDKAVEEHCEIDMLALVGADKDYIDFCAASSEANVNFFAFFHDKADYYYDLWKDRDPTHSDSASQTSAEVSPVATPQLESQNHDGLVRAAPAYMTEDAPPLKRPRI